MAFFKNAFIGAWLPHPFAIRPLTIVPAPDFAETFLAAVLPFYVRKATTRLAFDWLTTLIPKIYQKYTKKYIETIPKLTTFIPKVYHKYTETIQSVCIYVCIYIIIIYSSISKISKIHQSIQNTQAAAPAWHRPGPRRRSQSALWLVYKKYMFCIFHIVHDYYGWVWLFWKYELSYKIRHF